MNIILFKYKQKTSKFGMPVRKYAVVNLINLYWHGFMHHILYIRVRQIHYKFDE